MILQLILIQSSIQALHYKVRTLYEASLGQNLLVNFVVCSQFLNFLNVIVSFFILLFLGDFSYRFGT